MTKKSVSDNILFCEQAEDFDVIGIDEGQFFPDIGWAEKMANRGKVSFPTYN